MMDLKDTGDQPIDDITAAVDELMAGASDAADAAADVKTFRGRSLEELIPKIREELGSDAIVLRSREGLSGGVAGFFARQHVEVDARAPLPHERAGAELPRNDRATSEGLATPAVKALIDAAQPFSAELAFAQAGAGARVDAEMTSRASAFEADPLPAPGLYGPQPNLEAVSNAALPAAFFTPSSALTASAVAPAAAAPTDAAPAPAAAAPAPAAEASRTPVAPEADAGAPASSPAPPPGRSALAPRREDADAALPAAFFTPSSALTASAVAPAAAAPTDAAPAPAAAAPAPAAEASRTPVAPEADAGAPASSPAPPPGRSALAPRREDADAARLRTRLTAAGLSTELADDLLGEAIDHFLPFAAGRSLEHHVRNALARRVPVLADIGPGPRVLAFVGGGGSGKTSAAANLAVAYASAGRRVAAIALGDGSCGRDLAARLEPLGIFVHVAGTGAHARELIARMRPDLAVVDACESADPAEIAAVTSDLRQLRAHEVHLALPATMSAAAAGEAHARQRTLGVTHLCLTHADATERPGAPVGLAVERNLPLSYLCTRATIEPVEAAALASRLLP